MRAITVRQPWALHIIQSGKDVENRSRNIAGTYRGPVAIHAALKADEKALRALPGLPPNGIPRIFDYGVIIGLVDLVNVHQAATCWDRSLRDVQDLYLHDRPAFLALPDNGAGGLVGKARMCSSWAQDEQTHLVLANPRPLSAPIPCRGRLGLWTVPDDIAEQIGSGCFTSALKTHSGPLGDNDQNGEARHQCDDRRRRPPAAPSVAGGHEAAPERRTTSGR